MLVTTVMIPDPPLIRRRIYQLRTETRLLRISEDKAKVLPPHLCGDAAPAPEPGKAVPRA